MVNRTVLANMHTGKVPRMSVLKPLPFMCEVANTKRIRGISGTTDVIINQTWKCDALCGKQATG